MATVYTDVQALNPAFAALTQDQIDPWIERATRRCNATYFGDLYDDAVCYLAAHLCAVSRLRNAGATGAVSSATVGPLSASFAVGSSVAVPAQYAATQWGVEYYALLTARRFMAPCAL